MITETQFRNEIVRPTLTAISLCSLEAIEVIIATVAQEMNDSFYNRHGNHLACGGIIRLPEENYVNIWVNYLKKRDPETNVIMPERAKLIETIMSICNFKEEPSYKELTYNLRLNVIMCRLQYLLYPDSMPYPDNIDGIWLLYKKRYCHPLRQVTKSEFIDNYRRFTSKGR